jgi:UDP-glucuronate 4-epimerase
MNDDRDFSNRWTDSMVRRIQSNRIEHSSYLITALHILSSFLGDICDVDFIGDVFERERPSQVCHLAARAGVRASIIDPYIYVHSNIEGTTRLLDLARQYSVKNFVYASSSSVYGSSEAGLLHEVQLL